MFQSKKQQQQTKTGKHKTCLRSCRDKLDMEKNLVASLPVMRPSLSEKNEVYGEFLKKNKEHKSHWKNVLCCESVPESA